MFAFQLGREFSISIAEILTVFPEGKTIYFDKEILILEFKKEKNTRNEILKNADNLGGTIKIIEINNELIFNNIIGTCPNYILEVAKKHEGKFKYGINSFGSKLNIKSILMTTKKTLKNNKISSRFVNKDFKNLSSAQIIGEKLINKTFDFNIIKTKNKAYVGNSIWVQNIYNYSKRDWQKDRDMQVGMLPPKLAQIMINLSGGKCLYDPFVGLGTVLIESVLMGNKNIFGSDLSSRMVEISSKNISSLNKQPDTLNIFIQNAKYIGEIDIFEKYNINSIVTEGYLGEVMTQKNISTDRIEKQKKSLTELYNGFFSGLQELGYKGNIVISFPFWEIKGKYFYFTEIYDILNKYCKIQKLFPTSIDLNETKSGSLLYKRKKQLVGREIFKLKLI